MWYAQVGFVECLEVDAAPTAVDRLREEVRHLKERQRRRAKAHESGLEEQLLEGALSMLAGLGAGLGAGQGAGLGAGLGGSSAAAADDGAAGEEAEAETAEAAEQSGNEAGGSCAEGAAFCGLAPGTELACIDRAEAAPAEAAPAAEGDEEKAAEEGAEAAADPKAAKTKLAAPAMGAPAADFVNQLYENTKEYSFVDEAEKAMGIKVELAEELALFAPEDLMRCGMKKLKIRPFVNNVHKLEGFPQIDFTKVDFASWEALLKSEATTGDGAVAEAVLKEAGELAAATTIVGEAAAISAAGKSECTECNNGSNTESDQKHAKFTTSPWTCCTACALGKRANLYDQLKKAGVTANAALRVLGALKVHSAAA